MTTTDMSERPPAPAVPPTKVLRRIREGRVGAGVAGGLGRYFNIDPVLFRVLFATTAFFGGAGIVAYLLAWAAVPEEGTERAPIDGWIGALRRRRVSPWVIAIAVVLLLWVAASSWWAPGPVLVAVAIVVVLVIVFGRRDLQGSSSAVPTVNLYKDAPVSGPAWGNDVRAWWDESRQASRERARRALPVKVAALVGLGATIAVLAVVDAVGRVPIPVYFWFALGFVGAGLLIGLVLRRTPWSIATLLVPITVGLIGFAGSHASFGDGMGERTWTPTTVPTSTYRLAFGQGELDLRSLTDQTTPKTIRVTAAAGQIRIIVPRRANVTVEANVHIGQVTVRDGNSRDDGAGGVVSRRVIPPLSGATGAEVTVAVHLADGQIEVVRA